MNLLNSRILITGATGSFGQKLIRNLLDQHQPERLVIFSRDELKQYDLKASLEQEYDSKTLSCLRFFIGDVRDRMRLQMATRDIDVIIHAAALKHVPIAEYNPMECIRTNIHGAENVVYAALHNEVKKVIALSTDKACNPINLYGATKLASDKTFVAANNLVGSNRETRFSVVRYGNVVGSRGSVIPFFRKLIENGCDELPITDERMTRFWIRLDDGVEFVKSSLSLMKGGEIFVPKIPSVNIMLMANAIAPGLKTKIIGIRPGEKLHEVMISEDDSWSTVDLGDRYAIEPAFNEYGRKSYAETHNAKHVPDRFYYSSDNNPDQLDVARMVELLENAGV
ncbi:UDP-N-acetylglucosamine 4,6-dehydratase (inverting) [Labrenzia sp. PO1]|uniref:UDP-N-acetylglucosamine 4,6-dehydratase (inverting) n=1 Tax=Stappiaceae TaxID=2821832 RepID=UPI000AAC0230|nr:MULTISPECIES: UDP-N-acetylglucosamine 4,6-dehydratase (inverting) [Stappiaceae]NKI58348.1 UDP-N-acetylglucosamine 4,6-dehydratase (inverting) [Labrenzia sp. PO1]UFI05721.1 UDP-N-acetylglucosamine 4,6-dehydratase (inverting) [Roseibium aggregatum]